ncbi:MAG: glycosyltransferase family 4 protein [Flavobacteriaceae bacterium]
MKILYLTKYTRKGASSRLRSFQYFTFLRSSGVKIDTSPLFNEQYLNALYNNKNNKIWILLNCYFNRFLVLFSVRKYDLLVIEKELFPYLPAFFENLFFIFKINYVIDIDDAIFHNYDLNKNKFIRFFLKNKINKVMKLSSLVVVCNRYLFNKAKKFGAKRVEIIPTVIDIQKYTKQNKDLNKNDFTIGWIGSPTTIFYLKTISSALKEMVNKYDVNIHIIGAKSNIGFFKNVKYIEWSEESEVTEILKFDVGIMPLNDSKWEKGKCSYKIIQYMACKKPVIASPIGMNNTVITNNFNGFLAKTHDEWLEYLELYFLNSNLRKKHGINGFNLVEEKYCIQKTSLKLLNLLESVLEK